jgi:hypothetical protein
MMLQSRAGMATDDAISPAELANFAFSERDTIILTDKSQVEYLSAQANESLGRCLLLPLSLQAYAACLRFEANVRCYFDLIHFERCEKQYEVLCYRWARTWLKELGLRCVINGLDVAELDAPAQFMFFQFGAYLDDATNEICDRMPDSQTFYVVASENPLPLEYYFDSDVAAAVLQFALERRGRKVRRIHYGTRTLLFPGLAKRPFTSNPSVDSPIQTDALQADMVGVARTPIPNIPQILQDFQALNRQVVVFESSWGGPLAFSNHYAWLCQLPDTQPDESRAKQDEERLLLLWKRFKSRRRRSSLPLSLASNPYLEFQWEFIIRRRWLSYAGMIRNAKLVAAQFPLRLFLHCCDTATIEGSALAHFYRRAGTKILLAPHSLWPSDKNWRFVEESDSAFVFFRGARRRLQRIAGLSEVYVVQRNRPSEYRSLVHSHPEENIVKQKKSLLGKRKLVLVVTNALELLSVPFVDLKRHFQTLSVLARVPQQVQDSIILAIKPKRTNLGEDPILYSKLCGFTQESTTFTEDLDLSQCLQLAACAIGVNVPTNGYYEVLESGVPLIHVQTGRCVTQHPDLPARVIGLVRKDDQIWPRIINVLFHPHDRQRLKNTQRRFLAAERRSSFSHPQLSLRTLLERLSGPQRSTQHEAEFNCRAPLKPMRIGEDHDQGGMGYLDDIAIRPNGDGAVLGWAVDQNSPGAATIVHIYADDDWVTAGRAELPRSDVASALNNPAFTNAGFAIGIPELPRFAYRTLTAYAELPDGTFYQLKQSWGPENPLESLGKNIAEPSLQKTR